MHAWPPLKWGAAALCIGTALLMLGPKTCRSQFSLLPSPHYTFLSDKLITELDAIADTASIEHFRCLLGQRIGDTLIVIRAWEPEITHADYNTVTAGACPPRTVGTWHNHLPYNVPMNDPHNRATRVEPASVCEMSPADQLSAMHEAPPWILTVISVAAQVHCAWLRRVAADGTTTFYRLPWLVEQ